MSNGAFSKLWFQYKLFINWQKLKLQYGYPNVYNILKIIKTQLIIWKLKLEGLF